MHDAILSFEHGSLDVESAARVAALVRALEGFSAGALEPDLLDHDEPALASEAELTGVFEHTLQDLLASL